MHNVDVYTSYATCRSEMDNMQNCGKINQLHPVVSKSAMLVSEKINLVKKKKKAFVYYLKMSEHVPYLNHLNNQHLLHEVTPIYIKPIQSHAVQSPCMDLYQHIHWQQDIVTQ